MANLHGPHPPGIQIEGKKNNGRFKPGDAPEYMIRKRFLAWSRLILFDREQDQESPELFVTSSRSAMDYLLDRVTRTEKILTVDTIPVCASKSDEIEAWRDQLADQLQRLPEIFRSKEAFKISDAPADKNCGFSASMTIHVVPQESTRSLFYRCAGRTLSSARDEIGKSHIQNTFVGCISLHPTL